MTWSRGWMQIVVVAGSSPASSARLPRWWPAESAVVVPAPAATTPRAAGPLQTAVLAGGCFWGVQGVYEHVRGVQKVLSGYSGGDKATATTRRSARGGTGHAESVRDPFDPNEISYGEILRIYFSVAHDPTQLEPPGAGPGTQYRSSIFYASESQKKIAQAYIAQLDAGQGVRAADRHAGRSPQGVLPGGGLPPGLPAANPGHPYIVINDLPKIENLRRVFPASYREPPITVTGN